MNRLNYFNPYQSKTGEHEDQLTRAYLVLLKHSGHAFFTFVEYCRSRHKTSGNEEPISIIDFLEQGWEIETQQGNPEINTKYLLSILITDSQIKTAASSIQSSKRSARYDGIITFRSNLTMVIENKPRAGNVWFGQLNPAQQNLAEDTIVYSNPAVLEWKEIIKQLNHLKTVPTISSYENIMIEDFLDYIDKKHPHLNPYDSFHQCKRDKELLNRRIENLLKAISSDEKLVKPHQGRSLSYYIQTPYREIERICLGLSGEGNESSINFGLYFGDSQRQASAFYKSNPSTSHLQNTKWIVRPNFHVAFMSSNLVRFESEGSEHYLQFWKDNVEKICQQKKEDVPEYLKWLVDEKVINMPKEAKAELKKKFYDNAMQTLNICPGFELNFTFNISEAEELDKSGELKFILAEKTKEGLRVVGRDGHEFLKDF
jgi:hypothetical protein